MIDSGASGGWVERSDDPPKLGQPCGASVVVAALDPPYELLHLRITQATVSIAHPQRKPMIAPPITPAIRHAKASTTPRFVPAAEIASPSMVTNNPTKAPMIVDQ